MQDHALQKQYHFVLTQCPILLNDRRKREEKYHYTPLYPEIHYSSMNQRFRRNKKQPLPSCTTRLTNYCLISKLRSFFLNIVRGVKLGVVNLDTSNGSKNTLMERQNTSAILTNESLWRILHDLKNKHQYGINSFYNFRKCQPPYSLSHFLITHLTQTDVQNRKTRKIFVKNQVNRTPVKNCTTQLLFCTVVILWKYI